MKGLIPDSLVHREVASSLPRCGLCGLYKTCRSPKMPVYGRGGKGVLVVGEAPGETEDEKGRPFIGKAGQYLRQALREIGVDLDRDAWTTNAVICRPPKNKTPDSRQISYCRPNLQAVLEKYEPQVVVTLGKSALESVITPYWTGDLGGLERWTGWTIPLGAWICPTYHPSYLLRMRNPLMDREFRTHLRRAFGKKAPPPQKANPAEGVELIWDESEIVKAIKAMDREGGIVVVDYETNTIKPDWPKATIHSCALSDGRRTISFPWIGRAIAATGKLLASSQTRKIAHNLKFEERWTLATFGHGVRNWWWDTMIATHCLDNRPGICGLKFQALVRLGVPSYNTAIEPFLSATSNGVYNRIHLADARQLLTYGGIDALLEYRLAMLQRRDFGYED